MLTYTVRATPAQRALEIVKSGEIVLAAPDGQGGYTLLGRFRLVDGSDVTPVFQGLQPPTISIGEQGRDTQPFASSILYDDLEAGLGVLYQSQRTGNNRYWWATADTRRREQVTLLRRKRNMGKPAGVTTEVPRAGGVYNNRVWVAWGHRVRQWQESVNAWTDGTAASDRLLFGSVSPTNNPVEWEGAWLWPLGASGFDYWNGTAWVHVAKACVGFTTYAGSLWGVDGTGQVFSTNLGASALAAKIVAGTFGASDFTDRVRVSSQAQGMLLYTTADAAADVVPYVIGYSGLYQVDPATYIAQPVGPQLAPHRYPIRAVVLGSDNAVYLGQGLGVTQWTGDLATPVGLDLDDGVPPEQRGGIMAFANGGLTLFALVDGTRAETMAAPTMQGADPTMAGILGTTSGTSTLYGREPTGWHVRAVADGAQDVGASMLFVAAAENTYRVWFSWGGVCYSLPLEQGYLNPLDDPLSEYEPAGSIYYSITDMSFKEAAKIGLMAEVRVRGVEAAAGVGVQAYIQYNADGAWHPLQNADGSWAITTPGRHQYLLTQQPGRFLPDAKEDPAAGFRNDYMELRLDLWRGDAVPARTPVIVFAGLHAVKTTRPLTGWQFTLDLGRSYNNVTPWSQRAKLLQLIDASQVQLLHFAHLPSVDGPPGAPDVRAVRVTRFSGLTHSGLQHTYAGRIQMTVSEQIVRDADA